MPSIISYENGDGSYHTVASIDAAQAPTVIERSGAYLPVELRIHDLNTPDGLAEAVDDAAVASAVTLMQTGQKLGRDIALDALANWRLECRSQYQETVERAKDLGQVVVTLTAPTKEASEAILALAHEE